MNAQSLSTTRGQAALAIRGHSKAGDDGRQGCAAAPGPAQDERLPRAWYPLGPRHDRSEGEPRPDKGRGLSKCRP